MISKDNKENYLYTVSKHIRCSRKGKKKALDRLSQSIDDFLQQNEDVSFDELLETFGQPEEAAKELSDSIDPAELKKHKRFKTALVVLLCVLIAFSFVLLIYDNVVTRKIKTEVYYVVEGPVEDPEETRPETGVTYDYKEETAIYVPEYY
ncbi:MAG: hypothetical protein ACI4GY_10955 [Acutalibacteraceae bacterium]